MVVKLHAFLLIGIGMVKAPVIEEMLKWPIILMLVFVFGIRKVRARNIWLI